MLLPMGDHGQRMRGGNERSDEMGAGISPGLVRLLAVACGTTVANLYYAQPRLRAVVRSLSEGRPTTSDGCDPRERDRRL
jgi:hypothetical protein